MILIVRDEEFRRVTAYDLSKCDYISVMNELNELRIQFPNWQNEVAIKLPELTENQKGTLLGIISKVKNDEKVVFELNDLLKFVQREVDEDEKTEEAKA